YERVAVRALPDRVVELVDLAVAVVVPRQWARQMISPHGEVVGVDHTIEIPVGSRPRLSGRLAELVLPEGIVVSIDCATTVEVSRQGPNQPQRRSGVEPGIEKWRRRRVEVEAKGPPIEKSSRQPGTIELSHHQFVPGI